MEFYPSKREQKDYANRREFLACLGAVGLIGPGELLALASSPGDSAGSGNRRREKSVVVSIQSEHVASAQRLRVDLLEEMFAAALLRVTNTQTTSAAWRMYVKEDDIVGLKFNPVGMGQYGTSAVFARIVVESLMRAGVRAEQIVLIDGPEGVAQHFKTQPPRLGWTEETIDFGSGQDQLAACLEQITALINIPFLATDNITAVVPDPFDNADEVVGICGALKNISYHFVKHPARLHRDGCSPFMVDIAALPMIWDKHRLTVVNALKMVYDNGPLVDIAFLEDTGLLIFSEDPIAADAAGLGELSAVRLAHDLSAVELDRQHAPALLDASSKGLGNTDFRRIERIKIESP